MTRDDIMRMAQEAGLVPNSYHGWLGIEDIEYFAALVAAAERERAVQIAESMKAELEDKFEKSYMEGVMAGAAAERERMAQSQHTKKYVNQIECQRCGRIIV